MILDASALLAHLQGEPGADEVEAVVVQGGCIMSAVNFAEVLQVAARKGITPDELAGALDPMFSSGAVTIEPFTAEDAYELGRLYPLTSSADLSLGDRACLALAKRMGDEVLTGDRDWDDVAPHLQIRMIR